MGTINTILTAIVCSVSSLLASPAPEPKTEQVVKTESLLGKDAIFSLRAGLQNGDYDVFLKEMDASYQNVLQENLLEGIVEMRDSAALLVEDREKWENLAFQIQKEKKQALLNALPDEDNSLVAQKVRSAAATLSPPEMQKAIDQLSHFRLMSPNTGKNSDENRLVDLELEYEYKMIHLGSIPDLSNRREMQNILRMEKMKKSIEISKNFQDFSLKQSVELAVANFDERLAQNWDAADLNVLAKAKKKDKTPLEEKISSILISYSEKFSELTEQYFLTRNQALNETQK
ncbi:MAG: hypothetical protein V4487_00105 [Chlamydiota bacterium]